MDPVALSIGALEIRWYGIMMAASMLIGAWIASVLLKKIGRDGELVWDGLFWIILGGIAGARLAYIITSPGQFFGPGSDPLEMFKVWHGGLSFHGGIICGGIATYLFFRRHGVPFLEVVDSFTPGVGLGIILVRIGNFMNGDILGYEWEGPWAMNFPHDVLHIGQPDAVILRHPTEIYGMLVGVVTLATVLLVWRSTYIRKNLAVGMPLMALIISYSLARSIIEDPFRNVPLIQVVDPATAGFGLFTYSQIASVVLILIALAYIPYLKNLQRQRETGKADGESRQVRRAKNRDGR